MRLGSPRVDRAQSETLQRRREQLQAAGGAMDVLRRHIGGEPSRDATCTLQDESPDRFVLRVDVERRGNKRATYAFKVYADSRAARLWDIARAIRAQSPQGSPLCLPLAYVPELGLTICPWVHGTSLRSAIRNGDVPLVAHAALHAPSLLAWIHRAHMPREAPRTAQAVAARTHQRCTKLARSPQTKTLSRTLLAALDAAPQVPRRNIAFYYAVTLMQKLHMTWRERPADALAAIEPLAQRALRALEQVRKA